ncbi:MAG: hypothetical protein GY913_24330 [Proteobacteria bacterium]|nr:hypothetical protein [Pseudomonadota bacterium]MCP4920043.1 hypothetical protein [Pseudomonadota bacterium]
MLPERAQRHLPMALAVLAPIVVLGVGLWGPLGAFGEAIWGPEDAFRQGDFNGGWWLWWALAQDDALALVAFPGGVDTVAPWFPNPLQMQVLALFGEPTALAWNSVQLVHLVLLGVSSVVLARTAGATPLSCAVAGALVAASPVLLHEVSGGRPDNLVVWPGVLALAALWRGGTRWAVVAGLLAALQGVAYAWHGVALILVGLPLLRSPRDTGIAVGTGLVAVLPYGAWLTANLAGVPTDAPPAGYTALPLAGFWPSDLPGRFLVHPLLLPGALLALRGGRRWLAAGGIGVLLALGPTIHWMPGDEGVAGPWAWVAWAIAPASRMHHPVREALLALPLLATALALGLDRMRWKHLLAVALLGTAVVHARQLDGAAAYGSPVEPPFSEVEFEGPAIDLLGMDHLTALSLQTVHGQALVEPIASRRDHVELQRLAQGGAIRTQDLEAWADRGVETLLVLDRFGTGDAARERVETLLGAPVSPGVYSLSNLQTVSTPTDSPAP